MKHCKKFLFLLLLSGCVRTVPVFPPIHEMTNKQGFTSNVYVLIEQESIQKNIDAYNQSGLIPRLMNESLKVKAAGEITAITTKFNEYNFDDLILHSIKDKLNESVKKIRFEEFQVFKDSKSMNIKIDSSDKDLITKVDVVYGLTPDAKAVEIDMLMHIFINNKHIAQNFVIDNQDKISSKKFVPLFLHGSRPIVHVSLKNTEDLSTEQSIIKLGQQNSQILKEAVHKAINISSSFIAESINKKDDFRCKANEKNETSIIKRGEKCWLIGPFNDDESMKIFYNGYGVMHIYL